MVHDAGIASDGPSDTLKLSRRANHGCAKMEEHSNRYVLLSSNLTFFSSIGSRIKYNACSIYKRINMQ